MTQQIANIAAYSMFILGGVFAFGVLIGSYRRAFKAARELSRPEPRSKPDNPLTRQWVPQEPTK